MYCINKYYPNTNLSYESLLDILKENWLSTGYQSTFEESQFKSIATNAMKLYSLNPLDKDCDIVLLNKFIADTEGTEFKCAKIDKLHFLSNNNLEFIDYKSGKYLPPINKSLCTHKTLFTITSIKKKLGVYPDIFSLYYLRHGIKLSTFINLDIMFNINKLIETNPSDNHDKRLF